MRTTLPILALLAACGSEAPSPELNGDSNLEAPSASGADAWLIDEATQRGIVFEQVSGHRTDHLMPEIMGGGAALFDMDGDGDLDAYLVQAGSLYDDAPEPPTNRLFANRGDGYFDDVTAGSGAGDTGYGMGVACGDVDGDGDVDLYVTNYGPNVLLLNSGDGHFTEAPAAAGVADPSWGTSAAFLDLEGDGDLDLYVCNYLNWKRTNELPCRNEMGTPDYCSPLNYESPAIDRVFVNRGDGTFDDHSAEFGTAGRAATGLGVACADFDGDGRLEIFVANDGMPDFLWVPTTTGWTEAGLVRGCALDADGVAKAGMGVDIEDVDSDGDPDLLVCNLRREADSFYRNEGQFFRDRTIAVGLGAVSRPFTRFGLGWVDFDNDGRLDLYEANGRVMQQAQRWSSDPYAEPNTLLRGLPEGRFEPVGLQGGTVDEHAANSRAAAFGDVDGDGGIDVLVVNIDGPAQLFRNIVPARGAWISFELREADRLALHASVTIEHPAESDRRATRYARAAASYQASNDPTVHFGLGAASTAREVMVTWPDGTREDFGELPADEHHILRRGNGSEAEAPR